MTPVEVAAVLGLPAEDAERPRRHRAAGSSTPRGVRAGVGAAAGARPAGPVPGAEGPHGLAEVGDGGPVPPGLRAAVASGAGPGGAELRARLTRRARPFEPDGFPVPLDRHRLSRAALAWSVAAVVLLAVGMLVVLPVGGSGPVGAAPATPVPAAGPPPAAGDGSQPVPTLPASPFAVEVEPDRAAPTSVARPSAAPDRGAERRPAGSARRAPSPTPAGPAPRVLGSDDDRRPPRTVLLSVRWSPRPDRGCGDSWTADLRARPYGPGAGGLTGALATLAWADGQRTVALRLDGDEWRGELAGLPTNRPLTLTVRGDTADGGTVEASRRLAYSCG